MIPEPEAAASMSSDCVIAFAEGNRDVDRFVVPHGRIVKMDLWNDSAEWILDPPLRR